MGGYVIENHTFIIDTRPFSDLASHSLFVQCLLHMYSASVLVYPTQTHMHTIDVIVSE